MSPRSSQRVDRRRRVLVDESRNEGAPITPRIFRGDSNGPTSRYNAAALQAINAPIAKYVPLRPYWLLIWFLVGLIPVMGLLLMDQNVDRVSSILGTDTAAIFDLNAKGNFAAWFSSVAFAFAVALMLGVYSVRRHRRDDYRGRFTVWRWAIALAVLASVDATVGVHHLWQGFCQFITGTSLLGDGSIWWVATWMLLFGGMIARLLFEMSSSRAAIYCACGAIGCYLWSSLVEVGFVSSSSDQQWARTSQMATLMLGHHFLLYSLVHYAREVVLEAMGLVDSPAVRQANAQLVKAQKQEKKQAAAETAKLEREKKASAVAEKKAVSAKPGSGKVTEKPSAKKQSAKKQSPQKPSTEVLDRDVSSASTTDEPSSSKLMKHRRPPAQATAPDSSVDSGPQLRAVAPEQEDVTDSRQARGNQSKPKLKAVHYSESDAGYDDEGGRDRKLTKAEKRRLRKEQKRRKAA